MAGLGTENDLELSGRRGAEYRACIESVVTVTMCGLKYPRGAVGGTIPPLRGFATGEPPRQIPSHIITAVGLPKQWQPISGTSGPLRELGRQSQRRRSEVVCRLRLEKLPQPGGAVVGVSSGGTLRHRRAG